jgi:uncharacterized Tic20 family protein
MIEVGPFTYPPEEYEREKASNSYLMSLIAVMGGLPLPIINLLATLYFWSANRHSTYFVRWHCIQALLSQVSLLFINTIGFWWTISIIFRDATVTNAYIAYMVTIFLCNLAEFIATIYTAVQTRKGVHVSWWAYGDLTAQLVKP